MFNGFFSRNSDLRTSFQVVDILFWVVDILSKVVDILKKLWIYCHQVVKQSCGYTHKVVDIL